MKKTRWARVAVFVFSVAFLCYFGLWFWEIYRFAYPYFLYRVAILSLMAFAVIASTFIPLDWFISRMGFEVTRHARRKRKMPKGCTHIDYRVQSSQFRWLKS